MFGRQRRPENQNNNNNSKLDNVFSQEGKEVSQTEINRDNDRISPASKRRENAGISPPKRRDRNAVTPSGERQQFVNDTTEKPFYSSIPSRSERSHGRSRQPLRDKFKNTETSPDVSETHASKSLLKDISSENNSEPRMKIAMKKMFDNSFELFHSITSTSLPLLFDTDSDLDTSFYLQNKDPATLSLIYKQASSDSRDFKILTSEKYQDQKNRLEQIRKYYVSLQGKLAREMKMKLSIEKSLESNPDDREMQQQNSRLGAKMMDITKELWEVINDSILAERVIMKHICGAMVLKSEEYMKNAPTLKVDRSGQDAKRKLSAAEEKIETLEAEISKLNSKIEQLEATNEKSSPSTKYEGTTEEEVVSILPRTPRRTPPGTPRRTENTRVPRNALVSCESCSGLKEKLEDSKLEAKSLKDLHQMQIESMITSHQKEKDKALETLRKNLKQEHESRYEEEISVLKKQHESKIQEIMQVAELEKTEFMASFQKQQLESKYRLENSEQALLDAKRQFFSEKEKLCETIDILESKLNLKEKEAKMSLDDVNSRNQKLEQALLKLETSKAEIEISFNDLDVKYKKKDQELIDFRAESECKIDSLTKSFESKILELEREVQNLDSVKNEYQQSEIRWKNVEESLRSELEAQNAEVTKVKAISNEEVCKAQDSLFEANSHFDRVQRLLKDVSSDVNRYKKLADDRDQEIVELKKTIRSKDKELAASALAGAPDSSRLRRLVEQKDIDLEAKRSELKALKTDLSLLQRKFDTKEREIGEAKAEILKAANSSEDELMKDVARMQMMLMDLKTTRVDLLEKLDDSQHEVEMLKNQLARRKAEEDPS